MLTKNFNNIYLKLVTSILNTKYEKFPVSYSKHSKRHAISMSFTILKWVENKYCVYFSIYFPTENSINIIL